MKARTLSVPMVTTAVTLVVSSWLHADPPRNRDYGIIKTEASPFAKLHSVDLCDVQWTEGFWADQFKKTR